jgi:hypothetical protein
MGESSGVIIRQPYEDFAHGNIAAVFAVFDPGHSPLSGDFKNHEQIGGFFRRTMELSGGSFSIDVHNVLAADDVVVALATVNARRSEMAASFPEVHVRRLKNGKAIEFREYQGDEHLVLTVRWSSWRHGWPRAAGDGRPRSGDRRNDAATALAEAAVGG